MDLYAQSLSLLRLLTQWKDADLGIAELEDAKKSLAELKERS